MSSQCDPGGQSTVPVQVVMGESRPPFVQCRSPSTFGLLQRLQVQSLVSVQGKAQLPLLRHTLPSAHLAHATVCPQVLVRIPQRPAQVAPRYSGTQQVPTLQT